MAYVPYLSQQAMEFILQRKAADRRRLLHFVQQLSEDPFQTSDDFIYDDDDRRHEIVMLGSYRIVFWSDHAVKEVKIATIQTVKNIQ